MTKAAVSRSGPLEGIKILDFTQVLAGPYCTQLLGDMGAEVVKVEPPSGDPTRKWGPPFQGEVSSYFLSLNRNKRSIALNLREPSGVEIAKRLVSKSDVLLENFRPGVMKKLELDYKEVKEINPRIIYCSISGYGQTGPMKNKPGYDIAAYAASGIMSITGEESGGPVKTGVPIADIGAGVFAALSVCASLFERNVDQRGAYIDIALYDSMISWLTFQAGIFFATQENPRKMGSAHPLLVPYQAFRAKDRFFILAVGSDSIWKMTCKAIGIGGLADDARFRTVEDRLHQRSKLVPLLQKHFMKKRASYWLSRLESAGVPCSPISTVSEALNSDQTKKRKMILEMRNRNAPVLRSIALPMHIRPFGKKYAMKKSPPPKLGADCYDILKELGYSLHRIKNFRKSGVIF